MNLFEYATRNKLRFESVRGPLSAEQLWDVPLRSSRDDFNLNALAKLAARSLREVSEDNFVETENTPEAARHEIILDVIRHVIAVKQEEEKAAKQRADNRRERDKLLQILAEKQEGKLSQLSEDELRERIVKLMV